jgi:hypothetical protein
VAREYFSGHFVFHESREKSRRIPLALADLNWGLSIHFAFIFLKRMMVIKAGDARLFEISLGNDPMLGSDPSRIEYGTQTLNKILLENIKQTAKRFRYQTRCFYSGMILFIIRHVLEMVCASKSLAPNCFFCQ